MRRREAESPQGRPDWSARLARYGWYILLVALALRLLGGVLSALDGLRGVPEAEALVEDDPCPDPPCCDFGDLTSMPPSAIPSLLQLLGYTLAVALGVPSLLAGSRDLLRGRRAPAAGRLLAFFGPLLVLAGTELVPHPLPCPPLPWICEDHPRHGWSIKEQWHQLEHVLVGAVPLAARCSAVALKGGHIHWSREPLGRCEH